MALNATICKAELHIADMDRHYYQLHHLTLAQHPSETEERLMLRLLAFALHASDTLIFTKGLSTEEEPDLWQKDLRGEIELWIEVGLPSEKRLRKACSRAKQVVLYTYGRGTAEMWWKNTQPLVSRFEHLTIFHIPQEITKALAKSAGRQIDLQVNIQEGEISWLGRDESLNFQPVKLFPL